MERDIKLFYPPIPGEEVISQIKNLLYPPDNSRPFVGEGSFVDEFECACMKKFGFDYVLFTNSGTSALDLALLGADVNAGDEVITTPLTCTATNTEILLRQAIPVFADIQKETLNINPKDIEHRITPKTKAIMFVNWGGYPGDMDEINEIAKKNNLKVIVDGAHCLGAKYHDSDISKFADYTMISLQSIKQMTTIDGGLLAIPFRNSEEKFINYSKDKNNRELLRKLFGKRINDYFSQNPKRTIPPSDYFSEDIFKILKNRDMFSDFQNFQKFWMDWQNAESLRRRRWFGIGRDERIPKPLQGYSPYPTFECGGKFHANNLDAIIGISSLKDYDVWQNKRDKIVEKYDKELKNIEGIKLLEKKSDRKSGNWLYTILVDKRDDFVPQMAYHGIETSIVHERNDIIPVFKKYASGNYPCLDEINDKRVCLPLHQNMTEQDADYIISKIKLGW
ncbi:MAG: aminotransferase class V-fold PLP-dependent enzyme [Candidatus Nanoarchaeia archaeon]|nr:aminotransferase class V-fold PLP-dependent enzyme [Candidatus Nanoarchaeia archaeon]MDD5741442.1 aminotransferase class V-fold PLP-dependent enzyme [Candidatus Nanoarchaeia archaeon]